MKKQRFNLQEIFFFLILIAVTIGFYNILKPFIADVFLALILVILFKRPFRWLIKRCKGKRKRAAGYATTLVILTIILPLIFIGMIIINELGSDYSKLQQQWPSIKTQLTEEKIKDQFSGIPYLGNYVQNIQWEDVEGKADEFIGKLTQFAVKVLQGTFTGIANFVIHMFIVLFILFFMFADGDQLLKRLHFLIPLSDKDEEELIANIIKVTDGIVFNSFLLGIIEGIYGAILFAILGVPSPMFWGVIMAAFSIIPLVGTNMVLIPAALIYLLIGDYTTGILILTLGTSAVLINQNLIRPRLDAERSGMHTVIALIASLGGLLWMGVIGFLSGPIITAIFVAVWNQFGNKYKERLEQLNKGDDILPETEPVKENPDIKPN
jgi:predicted PurR-regulated permease PerM